MVSPSAFAVGLWLATPPRPPVAFEMALQLALGQWAWMEVPEATAYSDTACAQAALDFCRPLVAEEAPCAKLLTDTVTACRRWRPLVDRPVARARITLEVAQRSINSTAPDPRKVLAQAASARSILADALDAPELLDADEREALRAQGTQLLDAGAEMAAWAHEELGDMRQAFAVHMDNFFARRGPGARALPLGSIDGARSVQPPLTTMHRIRHDVEQVDYILASLDNSRGKGACDADRPEAFTSDAAEVRATLARATITGGAAELRRRLEGAREALMRVILSRVPPEAVGAAGEVLAGPAGTEAEGPTAPADDGAATIGSLRAARRAAQTDVVRLTEAEWRALAPWYNRAVWVPLAQLEALAARRASMLNSRVDWSAVDAAYVAAEPRLVVVDELLDEAVVAALADHFRAATMWFDVRSGYLGAYRQDGLANPVLARLAAELQAALPRAIPADLRLTNAWAYKYDAHLRSGIGPHADDAVVNINLWLTETEACLDVANAGLVVFHHASDPDWGFATYNDPTGLPTLEAAVEPSANTTVAYRQNRAVIFDSKLVHASGVPAFAPGYANRRINLTFLFGRTAKAAL